MIACMVHEFCLLNLFCQGGTGCCIRCGAKEERNCPHLIRGVDVKTQTVLMLKLLWRFWIEGDLRANESVVRRIANSVPRLQRLWILNRKNILDMWTENAHLWDQFVQWIQMYTHTSKCNTYASTVNTWRQMGTCVTNCSKLSFLCRIFTFCYVNISVSKCRFWDVHMQAMLGMGNASHEHANVKIALRIPGTHERFKDCFRRGHQSTGMHTNRIRFLLVQSPTSIIRLPISWRASNLRTCNQAIAGNKAFKMSSH